MTIGEKALSGTLIEQITVPTNVNEISEDLFLSIDNLKNISVSKDNKCFSIINNKILIQENKIIEKEIQKSNLLIFACRDITEATIPLFINKICISAFSGCNNIKSFKFEENSNLKYICDNAFSNSTIKTIDFPKTLTEIGDFAFNGCQKLESVKFIESSELVSIGKNAFATTSITSITIPMTTTHIGDYAFNQCNQL